jgi:RNA polymerase sigma-70 factor (ECF subfamily)
LKLWGAEPELNEESGQFIALGGKHPTAKPPDARQQVQLLGLHLKNMSPNPSEPHAFPSDEDLLPELRRGNEQAFVHLYRRHQGTIFRFVLHMTGSAVLAEDITQEVFLALLQENCGYDPQRGSLSAYLFGIARKLVLRQLEKPRPEAETELRTWAEAAAGNDVLGELVRVEGIDALKKAIRTLPRAYREVVVLCDIEEIDYEDAAALLGCPIGTVRSRLHRARALLVDKLHQRSGNAYFKGLRPLRGLV